MAGSQSSRSGWVAVLGGLAVLALGAWLTWGGPPERERAADASATEHPVVARVAPVPETPPARAPDAAVPGLRIAAGGRLALDRAALPDEGPLRLALDLSDEARGSGGRAVRIVADDGRRIDTKASPLPGAGSGVRLEIDPAFLSSGRYMLEIETADRHPLQIRRYVLELK